MIGPAEIEDMLLDFEAAESERKAALAKTGATDEAVGVGVATPLLAWLQSYRQLGDATVTKKAS